MASDAADLDGYTVLRADKATGEWNTIARCVSTTAYVDNTCRPGAIYIYKVKAMDKAENRSADSETVEAGPTGEKALVGYWQLDGNFLDATAHQMDAAMSGREKFVDDHKAGSQAFQFIPGNKTYLQLPYEVASTPELTFAAWVKVNGTTAWQRIFDFGRDADHYLFLTPNSGSVMRFAIKNGGSEQTVDCPSKLPTGQWKHVAVTIGADRTAIYIDGQEAASATGITITPADVAPVLNYLGRSQFNADPFLAGYLDDVRIYNYALSPDEVQTALNDLTNGIGDSERLSLENGSSATVLPRYTLDGRRAAGTSRNRGVVITENGKKIYER
jgi:hypothetical protein